MATKSIKLRYSIWLKILAWALCIASMCGIVFTLRAMGTAEIDNAVPLYADSYESRSNLSEFSSLVWRAYFQPSEEEIKSEVDRYVDQLKRQQAEETARVRDLGSIEDAYTYDESVEFSDVGGAAVPGAADTADFEAQIENEVTAAVEEAMASEASTEEAVQDDALDSYKAERLAEIDEKYRGLIAGADEYVRATIASEEADVRKRIGDNKDYLYAVVQNGEVLDTNIDGEDPMAVIDSSAARLSRAYSEYGEMQYETGGSNAPALPESYYAYPKIYVAMTGESYGAAALQYNQRYDVFKDNILIFSMCMAVFALGFVWLMISAGHRVDDDKVHLSRADKLVYLDIGFVLMLIVVVVMAVLAYVIAGSAYRFFSAAELDILGVFGVCACIGGAVSAIILWSMSAARRTKTHTNNEFTLAYQIFGVIKKNYDDAAAQSKVIAGYVGFCILMLLAAGLISGALWSWNPGMGLLGVVLFIVITIFVIRVLVKQAAAIHQIELGVEQVRGGNLDYQIPIYDSGNLDNIARGVNNIASGLRGAVIKEVKSERMKTELITNISHDLKTPLTSILTYVDLLKKEGLTGEAARYLEVLDTKSRRLQTLTDDLFEAAKASSGDMTVELSRIELVQFMEQAMAEMQDKMDASALAFMTDLPADPIYVDADGRLLFRVLGNVFDNAIKYSLEGSRVYVDINQGSEMVCVTVKNVSKEELNITEDELMERFVRGDSSRNTEGSGLGLAISKNFMQLMRGRFIIDIDGDLFKANIILPLHKNKQWEEPEHEQ